MLCFRLCAPYVTILYLMTYLYVRTAGPKLTLFKTQAVTAVGARCPWGTTQKNLYASHAPQPRQHFQKMSLSLYTPSSPNP